MRSEVQNAERDNLDLSTYFVVGTSNVQSGDAPTQLPDVVRNVVAAGVKVVQLREKDPQGNTIDAGEFYNNAVNVLNVLKQANLTPTIIINDRIDVAIALYLNGYAVSGVHIGQNDLSPTIVRKMLDSVGWGSAIIGLSCRTETALENAARLYNQGVIDYIGMGPVHTTQSKPHMPSGFEYEKWGQLREFVRAHAGIMPVVAIGGITPNDAVPLVNAGADGYCCISYIAGANDPKAAAISFVNAWSDASLSREDNKEANICK